MLVSNFSSHELAQTIPAAKLAHAADHGLHVDGVDSTGGNQHVWQLDHQPNFAIAGWRSGSADLRLRRQQMEAALQGTEENLLFLSQMNSMGALLNGRSPEILARAQVDFSDFIATHPDVFQARYLDEVGMEVVRIEVGPDGLTVVPSDLLQNKAERYYFSETMALPPGDVFISPIDLNREFGQIQEPHTLTLRYATPVFTAGEENHELLNYYRRSVISH